MRGRAPLRVGNACERLAADATSSLYRPQPGRAAVLINIAGWAACFVLGVALQRRLRDPQRASYFLFLCVLWILSPLTVIYGYTTVEVRLGLVAAFACVVAVAWSTLLTGMAWGRLGGRKRSETGVLAYATSMGNTAILGYPLATLVFGGPGLALAVVFTEFQFLIPTQGVILGLGRHYAGPDSLGRQATGVRDLLRSWFLNPPVVAGAAALALRLAGVDLTPAVKHFGTTVGLLTGFVGFTQLGLAISLRPLRHDRGDVWRTAVTVVLRSAVGPLLLLLAGWLTGIHIPGVFLLLAAMPVAFYTMVVAAVFDMERELARLLVVVSTVLVIAGVVVWQAVAG
jgi:predicted permease